MTHHKKQTLKPVSLSKKSHQNRSSKLLSLVNNSLVQFLIGLFIIAFLTQGAKAISDISFKLIFKTIGYGIFYYLSTPFIIYWLAYVSSDKLTKIKLGITIFLLSIYSFIFWDSYFFYKDTLRELLFYQW